MTKGWFITLVGCGLATYAVVRSQSPLQQVELGPAVLKFGALVGASGTDKLQSVAEEVKKGTPVPPLQPPAPAGASELRKLDELSRRQPVSYASANANGNARLEDVVGAWHDKDGAAVQISALGGQVLSYNEVSSFYGVPVQSAFGQGTWNGNRFEFAFNTLYGLPGVAVLQPSGNGTLVGNAFLQATGANVPLLLMR